MFLIRRRILLPIFNYKINTKCARIKGLVRQTRITNNNNIGNNRLIAILLHCQVNAVRFVYACMRTRMHISHISNTLAFAYRRAVCCSVSSIYSIWSFPSSCSTLSQHSQLAHTHTPTHADVPFIFQIHKLILCVWFCLASRSRLQCTMHKHTSNTWEYNRMRLCVCRVFTHIVLSVGLTYSNTCAASIDCLFINFTH